MAAAEAEPQAEAETSPLGDTLGDALPIDADIVDPDATCLVGVEEDDESETEVDAWHRTRGGPAAPTMDFATLKLPDNAPPQRAVSKYRQEAEMGRVEWLSLGEQAKPDHLKVPKDVYNIIDRLSKPKRKDPLDEYVPPPRHGHGPLEPRGNADPNVVRAFINRIDKKKQGKVEPQELSELSAMRKLGIKDEQIQSMFERIMEVRPPGKRHINGVSAPEIFNEMKVTKHWMTTIDLEVICHSNDINGTKYHVATEKETLERWCTALVTDLTAQLPPNRPDLEMLCTMPDSWAPPEIDRLFSLLLATRNADGSPLHTKLKAVQTLLKKPSDSSTALAVNPRIFHSVTVVGQRQDWGWHSEPYRNMWLRFFRAAGLQPLHPLQEVSGKQAALAETAATIKPVIGANVITAKKKSHATKEGVVHVRDAKPKVAIRTGDDAFSTRTMQRQLEAVEGDRTSWDEKRTHSESLVNSVISQGTTSRAMSATAGAAGTTTGANGLESAETYWPANATAPAGAPVSVSFDARRRFLQMHAKQERDSEQQRCIGMEKKEMARQTSLLGQAGLSVANVGVNFRGPHGHLGFSHHHLTNSVEPSRLKYEKELGHAWNGGHIDHTKEAPVFEDDKLSKMTAEERDRCFSSYFQKEEYRQHSDNQGARVDALSGVKEIMTEYKSWQNHEFRADQPTRHGKFGRRVFDAQVKEPQVPHQISGIDSKPMEEFNRQQELVHEFLDRSMPPKQTKHFEPYLPPAQFCYRKEISMQGYPLIGPGNMQLATQFTHEV